VVPAVARASLVFTRVFPSFGRSDRSGGASLCRGSRWAFEGGEDRNFRDVSRSFREYPLAARATADWQSSNFGADAHRVVSSVINVSPGRFDGQGDPD
jgi:hypothetical protein